MRCTTALALSLLVLGLAGAAEPDPWQTPLRVADLDPAVYAQWVGGVETPLRPRDERDRAGVPQGLVWTRTTSPIHGGRPFGDTPAAGPRHLRVGFTAPQTVGTLLVAGDVAVSVLKPAVAYPGDLGDERAWLPAQRLDGRVASGAPTDSPTSLGLWVLPPGTQTRALRFTHLVAPTDRALKGVVSGVYLLSGRWTNLAPLAQIVSRSASEKAGRLANGNTDGFFSVWDNISPRTGTRPATISADPEWLLLVWPAPVSLSGAAFVFPGFESAELQAYTGPAGTHPRDAAETDWQTVRSAAGFHNYYPSVLGVTWLGFAQPVTTRALRARLIAPALESRECVTHLKGNTNEGRRVWLGEWLALSDLGDRPMTAALPPAAATVAPTDLIPVKFTLPAAGLVTLVIEDRDGRRVRNLVSETPFPAGANTAWWDGTDDLGRDPDAARHGLYRLPAQFVAPGEYRVRGLWHRPLEARYEFGVYNDGQPPWDTDDHTGAWLANHTPPQAACFVPAQRSPTGEPAVYLGAYVTEGPDGLIWVDLDGRKRGGKKWLGGAWTAAPYLATDDGAQAVDGVYAYAASVWETGKQSGTNELRVTALTRDGDKPVLQRELGATGRRFAEQLGGLAVRDGRLAVSLTAAGRVLLVDARTGKVLEELPVASPRGLAFDRQGRLLALSGRQLLCVAPQASTVIAEGLEEPVGLTLDSAGALYISDRGTSHQVKVFTPDGRFVRAIGRPGEPRAGAYEPLHLNNPRGLAIDSRQHLWVAEEDYLPKRVSVWTLDGQLVKAFYGPSKYGGGGCLDAHDPSRFYYAEEGHGVLEFALDWQRGASALTRVLYRRREGDLQLPFRAAAPETACYREVGGRTVRYFTNCFNTNPTNGHGTAFVFVERDGVLRPAAGLGRGQDWQEVLGADAFRAVLPAGADFKKNPFCFAWSDRNGDGRVQPDEVQTRPGVSGGVTVLPDLSICVTRLGEPKGTAQALRFAPDFGAGDVPVYDLAHGQTVATGVLPPASSGGDQLLVDSAGNFAVTLGVKPYAQQSLSGGSGGVATWSYPNPWPGLHASHEAAKPSQPGQVIGATRLLGGLFTPRGSDVGPLWAVNGNMGNLYVLTLDGLFVGTLFRDVRQGPLWKMPTAERGLRLEGLTLHDENFWPTVSQTPDGRVYLVDGAHTCLVRVDGLESLRRLPAWPLTVTADDLRRAHDSLLAAEARRKAEQGGGVLRVARLAAPPVVDGRVDEWPNTWVEIDRSGVGANFNSNSKPYDLRGAVAVAGDTLFAAWQTGDANLLRNSGEQPSAPFKTGGTLELMLGTDPAADPQRRAPVAGDLRVLVTLVKGRPRALVYRPVAPGTAMPKVPFSSPWRTLEFDRVDDVSPDVRLATDGQGNYEVALPLAVLGLRPVPGQRLRGDLGVLRGDGQQTVARCYWSNKATSIVSDVPSEAELTPALWGWWQFD